MVEKRLNWIGFKWQMLGDVCEVIREQDGGWVYTRTRRGAHAGGGLLSAAQLQDYLAFEITQPAAPAQPADASVRE